LRRLGSQAVPRTEGVHLRRGGVRADLLVRGGVRANLLVRCHVPSRPDSV
jgi:hypothetical protein